MLTLLANDIGSALGQERGEPPAGDHESRPYYARMEQLARPVQSPQRAALVVARWGLWTEISPRSNSPTPPTLIAK